MIEVKYKGRLGNNLFQYCLGRILATEMGYKLKADPINGFPSTYQQIAGMDYSENENPIIFTGQKFDLQNILKEHPKRKIVIDGWFQRYEYYAKYSNEIRNSWLTQELHLNDNISKDDLIVGIRRGEFLPKHGIPLSYYEEAVSLFSYRNLYICSDSPTDPFVTSLANNYSGTIIKPNALHNLAFIQQFNQIIISNSSFLWWGAFLSKAEKIVFPVPLNGYWSKSDPLSLDIDLHVNEPQYHYLECKEKYQPTYLREIITNHANSIHEVLLSILPPWFQPKLRNYKQKLLKIFFDG